MNIGKISSPYGYSPVPTHAHRAATTQTAKKDNDFSINAPATQKQKEDTVSLSSQSTSANALTEASSADTIPAGFDDSVIPSWLGGYAHDLTNESFLGCPATYIAPENMKFSRLSSGEKIEYFSLLRNHINDLYEQNGLTDIKSKYTAFSSEASNEKLHQDFISRIKGDPRMFELVSKLGISLS